MVVQISMALTMILALVAYRYSAVVSKGLLAGGIGGILAFWLMAVNIEKLAGLQGKQVKAFAYKWTMVRVGIYGAVLVWGYRLDPDSMHGFLAAAGGILLVRFVLILLGLTGWDLRGERGTDGTHR